MNLAFRISVFLCLAVFIKAESILQPLIDSCESKLSTRYKLETIFITIDTWQDGLAPKHKVCVKETCLVHFSALDSIVATDVKEMESWAADQPDWDLMDSYHIHMMFEQKCDLLLGDFVKDYKKQLGNCNQLKELPQVVKRLIYSLYVRMSVDMEPELKVLTLEKLAVGDPRKEGCVHNTFWDFYFNLDSIAYDYGKDIESWAFKQDWDPLSNDTIVMIFNQKFDSLFSDFEKEVKKKYDACYVTQKVLILRFSYVMENLADAMSKGATSEQISCIDETVWNIYFNMESKSQVYMKEIESWAKNQEWDDTMIFDQLYDSLLSDFLQDATKKFDNCF